MSVPWDPPLADPNTDAWFPRALPREGLKPALYERCLGVERLLMLRAEIERRMNIDNFDSGPGLEDIVRSELQLLLPRRYSVRVGVVSDATGHTAGDCDVVLFNDDWFPAMKAGATPESRRWHYPIEGVFGVLEVKQSLSHDSLEAAMQKLVRVTRLSRDPRASRTRLVENRPLGAAVSEDCRAYTAVIAAGLADDIAMDELVHRFIAVNGLLPRANVVDALCVLGEGFVCWGFQSDGDAIPQVAVHTTKDDDLTLFPLFVEVDNDEPGRVSPFFELFTNMLGHLDATVLPSSGVAAKYGNPPKGKRPETDQWSLLP